MIEFGEFTPAASMGPQRSSSGVATIGRMTTTDEQWAEVRQWARELMEERKLESGEEARAVIHWANFDPSIVIFTAQREHLSRKPVWFIDKFLETTLAGAEIPQSEAHRFRVLDSEVGELHDKGLI